MVKNLRSVSTNLKVNLSRKQQILTSFFFGRQTIFIDAKKKIGSAVLGKTIPDGFLFDMSDPENREFYLVEVELASHGFYDHIFPQITKFFAFFKNSKRQKELIEKLFSTINNDSELKKQFKKYLGEKEIFKFLNDVIDSSQNILMVIDDDKPELPEIMDTYTDTWGKMVKIITIKQFVNGDDTIFSISPEFEAIEYSYQQAIPSTSSEQTVVSEEFHMEGVGDNVKEIYQTLKQKMFQVNSSLIFNVAKYYISIKDRKAFAYIRFRKKKIAIVVMLPETQIQQLLKHHHVRLLSQSVKNYYNGPCADVYIKNTDHIDEIIELLKITMQNNSQEFKIRQACKTCKCKKIIAAHGGWPIKKLEGETNDKFQ